MKKVIAILTVLALVLALAGAALAEELSYEGAVVAGETVRCMTHPPSVSGKKRSRIRQRP